MHFFSPLDCRNPVNSQLLTAVYALVGFVKCLQPCGYDYMSIHGNVFNLAMNYPCYL